MYGIGTKLYRKLLKAHRWVVLSNKGTETSDSSSIKILSFQEDPVVPQLTFKYHLPNKAKT